MTEKPYSGASFRVIYTPPPDKPPEVHACDIPQNASALFGADAEMPEPDMVVECAECGQRWIADYHSHLRIWSPLPRRRWWHRLGATLKNRPRADQ